MLPLIILLSSGGCDHWYYFTYKIRKENVPFAFGPYIAIAGWIAFLWGEQIMKVYLGPCFNTVLGMRNDVYLGFNRWNW